MKELQKLICHFFFENIVSFSILLFSTEDYSRLVANLCGLGLFYCVNFYTTPCFFYENAALSVPVLKTKFVISQFRIALPLGYHGEPIVSAPSVVISTLASGLPASSPAIVRAVPIDSTRVSVSWEPGPFPHGPILSYVLQVTENHPLGYSAFKVCYLLQLSACKCIKLYPKIQSTIFPCADLAIINQLLCKGCKL